ncbi:g3605 [Coccomyxa viridis]|uniref:alpha-amylase n=1 Tax=Coccomyxa viridis TaxID=1274662 RepID=A0ABP1FN70_9CHLO
MDFSSSLVIDFDNNSDSEATVVTLTGPDQHNLLLRITGALNSLGLNVKSASISVGPDNTVFDVFRVVGSDNKKIPEDQWEDVSNTVLRMLAGSSYKSSKPAIFGAAPAPDDGGPRRPLGSAREGDAVALEVAAAEMAQAASTLVAIERTIMSLSEKGADTTALVAKETERAEAAAQLERRMAAMEAVLAARRTPVAEAKPEAARGPGADLRFQAGGATASGPALGNGYEIILQGFNWESHRHNWYQTLKEQASMIARAGFTSIWLPPPSDSVSPQGYLPRDIYSLNSAYGSEGDLRELLRELHDHDLKNIADIVINHRCAHFQDEAGRWNKYGGRLPWDTSAICCNNAVFGGTGNHKTGEDYVAAPNIDHTQDFVRKDIIKWLKLLRSIGFDGFRFDFVKGYSGEFVKEYLDATVPELAFGEYWDTCEYTDGVLNYNQDAHRQRTVNWCDRTGGTSAAFDFTTKGILQEAMGRGEYWRLIDSQGRPPGLLGMWPSRAVSFIENHDTGSTLNHWPFPEDHLHAGYCYIITHPGSPCIFYDHFIAEGLGQSIRELITVRQKMRLHCRSKVVIQKASTDVYAASIDNKIAMKVGPGDWSPEMVNLQMGQKEWKLLCSGPQFAVWEAVH